MEHQYVYPSAEAENLVELRPVPKRSKPEPAPKNDIVTEDNAALEFVSRFRDKLRYCWDTGAWFQWDGAAWRHNRTGVAFQWTRDLVRDLSKNEPDKIRYVSSRTSFAAGVERFGRSDPAFAVTMGHWDKDPFLLGTPGGTVDLKSGNLRPARPSDGITKITAVKPADRIDCPRWLAFLDEATGGDAELIRFLQQWCGYCLTGNTSQHALVYIHGHGGEGKSVFLNAITGILKDYATTAAMDTFTASKSDKHPTDLAMLHGARLVTASETEESRAWAEARIKQMTGGDKIQARFMRQDFFEYQPQFKLTIVGNHKPVLRNVDDAAKRRFNIVPFIRKPAVPDRQLEEKLRAEWPGILRWMIAGCLDWRANGLTRPQIVSNATSDYFTEQDLFGQWLEEECDVEPRNSYKTEANAALFASWRAYAERAGEPAGSQKAFAENMQRRGLERCRTKTLRGFSGIRLKPTQNFHGDR